jgi:glycine/D-amino acid oxidase-like deaminating enzyme
MTQAEVVICGAGIAGIATAHALAVTHGVRDVLLVDERAPLTLTSDKSTEAYRNWWPGPDDAMVQLVNRSIDLLEQWSDSSNDRFGLNRRGYLYATRDGDTAQRFVADAQRATEQGAGAVRTYRSVADAATYQRSPHRGFRGVPGGADLFLDTDAIRQHFPWMHHDIIAVLHARRCGWFSGQQLGMYLLEEAKAAGVQLVRGRVERVRQASGVVEGVDVACTDGTTMHIATPVFVNAAGPYAAQVGALAGAELPLFSEAHYKIAIEDTAGVIDRDTGLVILDDAQSLE